MHACVGDRSFGMTKEIRTSNVSRATHSPRVGKKVARFSVATNEIYRNNKGEKVTETQWHNLIAWGKVADIAEKYLVKGTEVAIEGKLVNHNYTDKAGVKKYVTEVQVNEILLLGKKASA